MKIKRETTVAPVTFVKFSKTMLKKIIDNDKIFFIL